VTILASQMASPKQRKWFCLSSCSEPTSPFSLCAWWVKDDCCGVFCGITTNLLLSYAAFVQTYYVLGPWWGYLHPVTLSYVCLTLMAAACHARTQFTNPGAVPLCNDANIDVEKQSLTAGGASGRRFCKRCQIRKPVEAHHCSTCHRCIIRMDHHCPWVNNCVAFLNQKYFVLFCFYTSLCCLFSMASLVTRFLMCQSNKKSGHGIIAPPSGGLGAEDGEGNDWCHGSGMDVMCCIINMFEGILFGLFTMIMSCDQISSIISNVTYIDTLTMSRKQMKERKKQSSSMDNLAFIFGEPFGIGWFLPKGLTPKIRENFDNLCMQF